MSRAYLTIDDGPSKTIAHKRSVLAERDVPALFFFEGRYVARRFESVVETLRAGFHVGNHAYSHTAFSSLSLTRAKREVRSTDDLIEAAYERAGVERPAKAFRYPYGDPIAEQHRAAFRAFLDELGYDGPPTAADATTASRDGSVAWFWTLDCREYDLEDVAAVRERIDEHRATRDPDRVEVVLVHDHAATDRLFEPIVDALLESGLAFQRPV